MLINPFQIMGGISIIFIILFIIKNRWPTKVWINMGNGVYYSEWYYYEIWLPSRINELEQDGGSEDFEISDLPKLKEALNRRGLENREKFY